MQFQQAERQANVNSWNKNKISYVRERKKVHLGKDDDISMAVGMEERYGNQDMVSR